MIVDPIPLQLIYPVENSNRFLENPPILSILETTPREGSSVVGMRRGSCSREILLLTQIHDIVQFSELHEMRRLLSSSDLSSP